jgi:putative DNA primase/helicase
MAAPQALSPEPPSTEDDSNAKLKAANQMYMEKQEVWTQLNQQFLDNPNDERIKAQLKAAHNAADAARAEYLKLQGEVTGDDSNPLGSESKLPIKVTATPRAIDDIRNGDRLVEYFALVSRYIPQKRTWIFWHKDEGLWVPDGLEQAPILAKKVARSLYDEIDLNRKAGKYTSDKDYLDAVRGAKAHQGGFHVRQTLIQAQSELPVSPVIFDADPYLLNCLNGVVDLRTGKLREHRREDMMTRQCPVFFDPDAKSPEWEKFLNTALQGNEEVIEFIQRAAGYSLTGDCKEECFFFIHGPGNTGKGTFLTAVTSVLGTYQVCSNFETFLANRTKTGNGPTEDLVRLCGARFVHAQETNEGRRMDAG